MIRKVVVRVLLALVLLVVVVGSAFGFYVWRTWDRAYDEIPIPDVRASRDPAVIARGDTSSTVPRTAWSATPARSPTS